MRKRRKYAYKTNPLTVLLYVIGTVSLIVAIAGLGGYDQQFAAVSVVSLSLASAIQLLHERRLNRKRLREINNPWRSVW